MLGLPLLMDGGISRMVFLGYTEVADSFPMVFALVRAFL